VRWLVGFAEVYAQAGETVQVTISIRAREFAHWDNGWKYESGEFTLKAGGNVMELPLNHSITLS
jgi:beta-glucosidase